MNAKHYKLISISLLLHKEITITRQHLVHKNLFHPHFHMFSFLFISFNFQCNIVQRINVRIISISHINPSSIFRSMRGRWAWVCWRLLALNILRIHSAMQERSASDFFGGDSVPVFIDFALFLHRLCAVSASFQLHWALWAHWHTCSLQLID